MRIFQFGQGLGTIALVLQKPLVTAFVLYCSVACGELVELPNEPEDVAPYVNAEFADWFSRGAYRGPNADSDPREVFYYRLFSPAASHAGPFPIVVWLHGRDQGGKTHRNNAQLKHLQGLFFSDVKSPKEVKFFVLAVQCPERGEWFSAPGRLEPGQATIAILRELRKRLPIDPERIYLSGASSGGTASWEMAVRYPDLFAAIVPLASAKCDASRLTQIVDVPLWAFNNWADDAPPPDGVRENHQALKRLGGNCALTETDMINDNDHDCWNAAYGLYGAGEWMFAQRKGEAGPPPGSVSLVRQLSIQWQTSALPQFLIWIAIAMVFRFAWISERRRREHVSVKSSATSA